MRDAVKLIILPLVAVFVAIAVVDNHLFYKIPRVGFYLALLSGGGVVPFKGDEPLSHCMNPDDCPWLQSGDVVIDVCGKCGNNWLMTLVHELRTVRNKELQEFNDILEINPWPNLIPYPGVKKADRWKTWGNVWNNTALPFRQYKATGYPDDGNKKLMPVRERPDLKYLVMVRKAEDQFFSLYKFLDVTMTPPFRVLWGGAPSQAGASVDTMITMLGWAGNVLSFRHLQSWWPYRHDPNVMLLHYSNAFKEPERYIRKIADFVGIHDLTQEELDEVSYRVSVGFMKSRNGKYKYMVGKNKDIPMIGGVDGGPGMIRAGGDSTGKKMTDDQLEKIRKIGVDAIGEELVKILEDGFEV